MSLTEGLLLQLVRGPFKTSCSGSSLGQRLWDVNAPVKGASWNLAGLWVRVYTSHVDTVYTPC